MGNYKRNNSFGGKRSGGFSDRDSRKSSMHRATCSDCGSICEVPFRPTGNKPVFCSECFRNKDNSEPNKFRKRDSGRFDSREKRMHQTTCSKCRQKCEVPFKPTGDKPVFCSECFGGVDKDKSPKQDNKQFEIINTKLDKILKVLSVNIVTETKEEEEVEKPKKIAKSKEKKVTTPKKAKKKTVKAKVKKEAVTK